MLKVSKWCDGCVGLGCVFEQGNGAWILWADDVDTWSFVSYQGAQVRCRLTILELRGQFVDDRHGIRQVQQHTHSYNTRTFKQ